MGTTGMASQAPRPRSNTSGSSNSLRPKSCASNASAASASTQPIQQYQLTTEPSQQFIPRNAHTPIASLSYTPEEMITRSEHQLTNPNQGFMLDPSLQTHIKHDTTFNAEHPFNVTPSMPGAQMSQYNSFEGSESLILENANEEHLREHHGVGDGKKKKGSASSIANDIELRRLFRDNQGRSLKEVAAQVLANERGPKSEKTKQIFAMLWLCAVCKKSNSSVPRNRVFSRYATRCGTERVPPLNPASFGKLVRIIFPGIQTRRLGMRGESKYHYVDLSLIEDAQGISEANRAKSAMGAGSRTSERPLTQRQQSQMPPDTDVFPSPELPFASNSLSSSLNKSMAPGGLYLDPVAHNIHQGPAYPNMVRRELKFSVNEESSFIASDAIELPIINKYLPMGTDIDSANALTALYRTHCISVIDCFRFCKEKMFWHHFTSLNGTLTVPSQKLLASPSVAPWIKECDWLMYQKMIQFVAPLALQVIPIKAIETFRSISLKLGSHLTNTFQNLPQHVQDAKLGPAIIFASLLDRLLRVNATAHAAANMLTNEANREQMWHDWVLYVKPVRVVETSLPGCGYTRVLQILTTEIRDLLGPLRTTAYLGMDSLFAAAGSHGAVNMSQHAHPQPDESSTGGVLDRWTIFLQNLPSRFPGADARLLLNCVGEVGSAALRDITMAQALSFGSWWVTKVWVDEMLQWQAEKGGFMENSPRSMKIRGSDFFPDEDFPMDDNSELFGGSRPRTAVSESVDGPSRFGSVDVGGNFHREQTRAASVSNQTFKHPDIPMANNQGRGPSHSRRHSAVPTLSPTDTTNDQQIHGLGISHHQLRNEGVREASSTHVTSNGHIVGIPRDIEVHSTQNNDDSGIAMGIEDDDLSMPKFAGFEAGCVNGSDSANISDMEPKSKNYEHYDREMA